MKSFIVSTLCPNIVESEKKMRIDELSAFLEADETEVRKHNNKFICMFNDTQVCFDEEPTVQLLEKYKVMPDDFSRQIEAVEDLVKEITFKSEATNPFRNTACCRTTTTVTEKPDKYINGIRVKQPQSVSVSLDHHEHPPCVNCRGRDYINCTTHWTCRRCAVVRKKIHEGVAYREMRDREVDMNGRSMEINTLYSDSFNRQTDIILPKKTREWERLQRTNDRLNGSKKDSQIYGARVIIEDICSPLQLGESVIRKAHILFCKHRKTVSVLRSEMACLAACLFYSLPKKVKVYRKKKKILTPWVDSKKRKLKVIDFTKPVQMKRKRRYSVISTLKRKKTI